MVSKYPTQAAAVPARGRARALPRPPDYRGGRSRPAPRTPYRKPVKLPDLPVKAQKRALAIIGRRVLPRLIPYAGWALTAYEVYELWNSPGPVGGSETVTFPEEYWTWNPCPDPLGPAVAYLPYGGTTCAFLGTISGSATAEPPLETTASKYRVFMPAPGWPSTVKKYRGDYTRKLDAPVPTPVTVTETAYSVPNRTPTEIPFEFPHAMPQRAPSPSKWQKARPGEEPAAEPQPDPAENPRENPSRRNRRRPRRWSRQNPRTPGYIMPNLPVPFVRVNAPPALGPVVGPGTTVEVNPAGKPVARTNKSKNPTKNDRKIKVEVKPTVRTVGGAIWTGLNGITEVFDFLEAMHDGVNRGHRLSLKASKADKVEYMLTNLEPWKNLDYETALENYLNNQISDAISAMGSDAIKSTYRQTGSITGLDRAIREHGDRIFEGHQQLAEAGEVEAVNNWTPEIDIDLETGQVEFSSPYFGGIRWNHWDGTAYLLRPDGSEIRR